MSPQRWIVTAALVVVAVTAVIGSLVRSAAQEKPPAGKGEAADAPEVAALRKTAEEFVQAFNKGDAKAAAIYAGAFGQNPEFYAFYRSLEAYRASFKDKGDVIVVPAGTPHWFKEVSNPFLYYVVKAR